MITPSARTNYAELMRAFLLFQFKDAENINKLLAVDGEDADELEALAFSAVRSYFWDVAEGAQLDVLGRIVGFERQGRTDINYKTLLQLKVELNVSGGEIPVLLRAIRKIFNATIIHYYQDYSRDLVAEIFTDGDVNLFEEFGALCEDGDDLVLDRFAWQTLTDEAGEALLSEDLEEIKIYDYDITGYDELTFTESDVLDETILYDVLPAGVGLAFLAELTTETGENLVFENGENIYV